MTAPRTVLASERKLWRTQAAQGLSVREIARLAERHSATVYYHLDRAPLSGLRRHAERVERLFAACNRAVSGDAR